MSTRARATSQMVKASRIDAERMARRIDWRSPDAAEEAPLFAVAEPAGPMPDVVCTHCGATFPADRIAAHRRRLGLDGELANVGWDAIGGEYVPVGYAAA